MLPALCLGRFVHRHRERIVFGSGLTLRANQLELGSPAQPAGDDREALQFYASHWHYFETLRAEIANPIPVQGRATLPGLGLPAAVLERIYLRNAERLLGLGEDEL